MLNIILRTPHKLTGLYRATGLRMPFVGEPVVVYHDDVKIGKGKVVAVDGKKRTYDVELKAKEKQ